MIGSEAFNQALSERHAEAVCAYLTEVAGIDPARRPPTGSASRSRWRPNAQP